MAIAEVGGATTNNGTGASLTTAITVGSGGDAVVAAIEAANVSGDTVSRTLDGNTPDDGVETTFDDGGFIIMTAMDVWAGPTTESSIDHVVSGLDGGDFELVVLQPYSGVDQTTPEDNENSDNTDPANSQTVTTTSDGLALVAFCQYFEFDPGAPTPGSGDTLVGYLYPSADGERLTILSSPGNGSSVTVSIDAGDFDVSAVWFNLRASSDPVYEQETQQAFDDGDELPHFDAGTLPVIEGGDVTTSGSNTATTSPSVAYPAYGDGDLLVAFLMTDDDDTITPPATGPNGETRTIVGVGDSGSAAGPSIAAIWWLGTAAQTSGNQTWTISAAEGWVGRTIKVLSGEFDPDNPIDSVSGIAGSSSNSANVPTPSWTCTRAGGKVVVGVAIDADPFGAAASGWTNISSQDIGSVSGTVTVRDAATTAGETISSVNHTTTSDTSSTLGLVVNAPRIADGRTPLAAADANVTIDVDTAFGLQTRVYNSGGEGATGYKYQYRKNAGAWTDLTTSSSNVKLVLTADYANGDDVLEYLSGSGTFVANNNAALESTGTITLPAALGAGEAFESHITCELVGSDLADEDTIGIRLVETDGTALDTYTATITITANETAVTATGSGALAFPAPGISASGAEQFDGTATIAVLAPAVAGNGRMQPDATATVALDPPALVAAGSEAIPGSGAIQVQTPSISGTAAEQFSATATIGVGAPAIDADGFLQPAATGTVSVNPPSLTGAGLETAEATGAITVAAPGMAASGILQPSGTASLAAEPPAIAATATNVQAGGAGVIAVQAPSITATAVMQPDAVAMIGLTAPSLVASGTETIEGAGTIGIPPPALTATAVLEPSGTAAISVNAPGIAAVGAAGQLFASGTLGVSAIALSAAGEQPYEAVAAMAIEAPSLQAAVAVAFSGAGAVVVATPAVSGSGELTVTSTGVLGVTSPAMAGTGQETIAGSAVLSVEAPALSAVGLQLPEGTGSLAVLPPSITATGLRIDTASTLFVPTPFFGGLVVIGFVDGVLEVWVPTDRSLTWVAESRATIWHVEQQGRTWTAPAHERTWTPPARDDWQG